MKNIIIGTAGHVDHGKTQLIKALSGIDTDRLSEEKKRGITIELGFAHISNDEGFNIGVIDVPGHEKFIKNMLAGIGGIDFVLMVVAADEGIMPQTKEHFEILQALGINEGIIAVTKIDMVDDEWLEMLQEDVREYFSDSFLKDAPMIPVSARKGTNIDVLKKEILKKCHRDIKRIEEKEQFRLPIDRVFSMTGFGTVVTGTLIDGVCSVNDEVIVFPEGTKTKIRGIQTYGKDVNTAVAGQRTAINLANIKKEDIKRGDILSFEHALNVTRMIDVSLSIFKTSDRTVLNNSRVHLYCGSKEALCKVIILDRDSLSAGEKTYAQLRLEEPIAVRKGDRFIIRYYSPIITIGGGEILDALPMKHKRNKPDIVESLKILEEKNLEEIILLKTNQREYYTTKGLAYELGILPKKFEEETEKTIVDGKIIKLNNGIIINKNKIDKLQENIENIIEEYHRMNPLLYGIPKQELRSKLADKWHMSDEKILIGIIEFFQDKGIIINKGKFVSLKGFKIEYTGEQEELKKKIIAEYEKAGLDIIKNEEILKLSDDQKTVKAILSDLAENGITVKVNPAYYIISECWDKVVKTAEELSREGDFTLAEYRDRLGSSRKYAAIFLQTLDLEGITVFNGETRTIPRINQK